MVKLFYIMNLVMLVKFINFMMVLKYHVKNLKIYKNEYFLYINT